MRAPSRNLSSVTGPCPKRNAQLWLHRIATNVNSSLQRARATLRENGPSLDELREPADPDERAVVERYLAAFEAADVPGLTRLLAADVILEMPPVNLWLAGRAHYGEFMERVFAMRGTGWRLRPVPANGTTALAAYAPGPHSVQVFDVAGGLIERIVTFVDPAIVAVFDAQGSYRS
jgi:RNA polymerase sigma-70 factor (ECF subfamily)